ncbi:hypothetical protein Daesc_004336 [Daldinia eschscholtzii]|uniref:Uncharacterized protein n=1 Tax=Daldinia eschscholtzii TaxID=292717 RepID=A0AAX6MP18_9PEZI
MCLEACLGTDDRYRHQQQQQERRYNPPHPHSNQRREATRAAQNYGWPREPTTRATYNRGQAGNRDSYLEPELAATLTNLPGSEFRRVYDPERPRYPPQDQYYVQPSQTQHPHTKPPIYHIGLGYIRLKDIPGGIVELNHDNVGRFRSMHGSVHGVVREQPRRTENMTTHPRRRDRPRSVDSNGVSDLSSDEDGDSDGNGRVFGLRPPPAARRGHNLYSHTGHSYGRGGAF